VVASFILTNCSEVRESNRLLRHFACSLVTGTAPFARGAVLDRTLTDVAHLAQTATQTVTFALVRGCRLTVLHPRNLACLSIHSAIKIVAAKLKVKLPPDMAIDSEVDLCTGDDGTFSRLVSMSACLVWSVRLRSRF